MHMPLQRHDGGALIGLKRLVRAMLAVLRNLSRARVPLGIALLAAATCSIGAETESGPDPFRTDQALHRATSGLSDPLGYDCATPARNLTFAAAVQLALCANPQTRSAWAQAHEQAAAVGKAESAWLPQISASASESRFFGEHADVNGEVTSSTQNTTDAAANLTWTLYDFGGRSGRIESARRLLDAAAATASSVVQQTVRTTVQAYYGVVADDANVVAAKSIEETSAQSVQIARALQTGGAGTLGDVLQAQTAYQQFVLARVQAQAADKTAHGTLAVTLGKPADQYFILAPDRVPTEVPALSARMADLMNEASRQRPDLAAARFQRDAAQADIRVARAAGLPSISIGAEHHFTSTTGVPNQNFDQIGISVTIPIFSGFNVHYSVRQAQAALHVSEANLQQVELSVTQDVWSGYYNVESANQQLATTSDLLKTAEENLEVSIGRYKAGVGSIVDVLTAQTALATARQVRINAELGWFVARAQLAFALGRLSNATPLAEQQPSP
jgi:TolC family type I secretion outer membrane protein